VATDSLKLVRWTSPYWEAQRPVVLANLTIPGQRFISEGASPQFVPGEHETGNIRLDVPYAGEIATLDRHGNSHFTVTLRCMAADPVAEADALVAAILMAPARSAIEWRRDGTGIPTYFPIRGDAQWTPTYEMRQRQQGAGMLVALSVEVAPYVHHGSMDVFDDFETDSISDYTINMGTGLVVTSGLLFPSTTTEKRLTYSARGHAIGDGQVTAAISTTTPTTGLVFAPRLKTLDTANWIEARLTASTLSIWKYDAGTPTQLDAGVSFVPAINTTYWVRLRIEGLLVTAAVFSAQPTPMGTPAAVTTHTLAGANATKYGTGITGSAGLRWIPSAAAQAVVEFAIEPYTYRNLTLPQVIQLGGAIPGDLPALCDIEVTSSGGAAAPVAGLFGWTQRPTTPGYGVAPFGIIEAESATLAAGFSVATDAGARGGNVIGATALGVAWWYVDASTIPPDDDGSLSVEVFARCAYNTSTGFNIQLFADPRLGTNYGARRYSDRGAGGLRPTAGSGLYGMRRLGRIRLNGQQYLGIQSPASPAFVVDYLVLVPSRSFAESPMGVALDSAYPKFAPSTAETTRTLLADGGSTINAPGYPPMAEHGLGRRIEFPVGNVDLLAKQSSVVIDRPEVDATAEQLAHTASVHVRCLPRFAFA
jgi:hypothetical protein